MTTQPPKPQPTPQPAQPSEPLHWWNDKERLLRGLAQSNYVTAFWDWCMMLLGKAAEPVLFVSVLYSGYELLPGVPQPGAVIDAPMFVTQQAALDIGGLGLMKMAKHARLAKDSFPYCVGVILVVLMIVNVAMASLEKVVHPPPLIATGVEGFLLIARAVMAVLYGHAIHALKDEGVTLSHGQSRVQAQLEQVQQDVEDLAQQMQVQVQQFAKGLASVQKNIEQRMQESATLQERRLHLHLADKLAPLQEQLALLPQLQVQVQELASRLQEESQRLQALQARQAREQETQEPAYERPHLHALPSLRQPRKRKDGTEQHPAEKFDARAFVFACLQDYGSLTLAAIRERLHAKGQELSESTISRYRKEYVASKHASLASSPDAMQAASSRASERMLASE